MCPQCKGSRLTYVVERPKRPEGGWKKENPRKDRTDFRAKCPDCSWEGEY
jgi:hypothetical protein